MSVPFKRFTVHTVDQTSNRFSVYVSDLEGVLKEIKDKPLTEVEVHRITLERALFIQQAIDEKLLREGRQ